MQKDVIEEMDSGKEQIGHEAPACPMHALRGQRAMLDAGDELVLPMHKRVITQFATTASGVKELRLYYGDKEISFDEPDLFAFGETLGKQSRFAAGAATTWGDGYDWPRVKVLLEHLIEEGILQYADPDEPARIAANDGDRPSPLPPALTTVPRTWFECEAITRELTGRPLELGYLEMVMPIFRVAHMAMDAEGRQVGEANVFPRALRLDVPTRWRTCIYPGSRFQSDRPMNVTALKSMRVHWAQMMAALLHIRDAYLQRFPAARAGWTVGHLERLSTVVLAVPTYLLMRTSRRVENGQLHPVLSCLFRVTDGLRMTMHQMLFVPIGEPTLAPEAPMTGAEVLAYAERNYSFHSEHGVCAGPKVMMEDFLGVLVDGRPPAGGQSAVFDAPVQAALDDLDSAIDYALYGLQVYAAIFSLWPVMTRTYEQIFTVADAWAQQGSPKVIAFRDRLRGRIDSMKTGSYLGTEERRVHREQAYSDMYEQCAAGLRAGGKHAPHSAKTLAAQIAPQPSAQHADLSRQLGDVMKRAFDCSGDSEIPEVERLAACVLNCFLQEQAILRVGCDTQQHINSLLGRTPPTRPFGAAEVDIHNLLQGTDARRLPYLVDELEELLGIRIVITQDIIEIARRTGDALI